ncbi:growth arrest and DNA damage-inducible protein GADD45 alpha [Alligator mississippiensis]|uniref:Growth arrest and DNA damage-inducible protein GADD45 alpha n=1 Tax=Alligator mississippiensis TaxID=8496 RepID=A0A151NK51_ALLMI|nr:growth arrest and DNA damage-inducible protein GADD45 alpha [Alligator mississippiensis]
METAGSALQEVLSKALSQRSVTVGVYEAAKLLNVGDYWRTDVGEEKFMKTRAYWMHLQKAEEMRILQNTY